MYKLFPLLDHTETSTQFIPSSWHVWRCALYKESAQYLFLEWMMELQMFQAMF